jgi:aminoglycoside 6'-N-acetyltransferase I
LIVRQAANADFPAWAAMRRKLWPDQDPAELESELAQVTAMEPPYTGFVAEEHGRLIGFIEVWVRGYAEGAPVGPAAYVEGLWVEPEHRRRGVARAMLEAAEQWARARGLGYIGSDALIDNDLSHAWHKAAGFAEIERLVVFGKKLA